MKREKELSPGEEEKETKTQFKYTKSIRVHKENIIDTSNDDHSSLKRYIKTQSMISTPKVIGMMCYKVICKIEKCIFTEFTNDGECNQV